MKYTNLGKSGITVSEFCLGTMMFGQMGNQNQDDCIRIIHKALEGGINFVDTAHFYSAGEAEKILARALIGRRDNVILSTKFSGDLTKNSPKRAGSRNTIIQELDKSLRRLNTDYIDLYQIARFDDQTDLEETISTLSDLVRQGKIRTFGSSMFSADQIVEGQWISQKQNLNRFRCEQACYSIFSREIEQHVLPVCQRYGLGAMVWSPLDGGWLTGRYLKKEDFNKPSRITKFSSKPGVTFDPEANIIQTKLYLLGELNKIAEDANMSLTHMSMAFSVEHPGVTSAIIGPRTMEQLDDLMKCADLRLDKTILDRIDQIVPPGSSINGINMTAYPASLSTIARRQPMNV